MIGAPNPKYIETLEGKFPFVSDTELINYWIIKSDSLGNIKKLATGSYNKMKEEYLKHGYTTLDGYYIVEMKSVTSRVVKS